MDQSPSLATALALALHSFGNPACQQAAEQLEHHAATTNGLTLEFRSLQLSVAQVEVLADDFGLDLIAYEGGQHLVATGANVNINELTAK